MIKEIKEFKNKFYKIRSLGYVESINNNDSGVGLTFEKLLGKEVDNFPLPDFMNTIEIKTKLAYSKKPIHLFRLTPEGDNFFEIKNIINKYGYYSSKSNSKKLNCSIFSDNYTKIGLNYFFSICVDYKKEKIILLVYNKKGELIDDSIYWSFNKIKNALKRKLQYLAFVQAWNTKKHNKIYYKYFKYNIYKLSNFYNFLNLIDKSVISISFSVNTYLNEKREEKIHDHGTNFDIKKEDLDKLFFIIE